VLLHPGSGSARKNWPARSFAAVAEMLLRRGIAVRLVVGEADVVAASRVEQALGRRLPRLTMPALAELAAELASSRAYLGNDSGVSHLAGLVGVPTFALFGPTDPRQWRPLGPRVTVLPFDITPAAAAAALSEA
jgi:ADP-heptose:LPS heptosyltransferase